MSFSKINAWLHLWLGLVSGLIVFFVAITGCILVFEDDIKLLTRPYLHAEVPANMPLLPPSVLAAAAGKQMPGLKATNIRYIGPGKTAEVSFRSDSIVYVHPYTAQVTAIADHEDFFHEITEGHTSLWLPPKAGRMVVTYATLIFTILLITGMVLWWPKKWNRHNIRNAFTILWTGKFKRVNYDLHNVLGFYTIPVTLIIAYSGLFMGLGWVAKSAYWVASGGQAMPVYYEPPSDTTLAGSGNALTIVDQVWERSIRELSSPFSEALIIGIPDEKNESIYVYTNTEGPRYQVHYFDQVSGALLKGTGTDVTPYSKANGGDQLRRLNYSLHVGSIWGLPSKLIYFLASFVAASLPVTGFYIWWGKKKKKKTPPRKKEQAVAI
jgi:uncharacterized iron-regulated membrane protein